MGQGGGSGARWGKRSGSAFLKRRGGGIFLGCPHAVGVSKMCYVRHPSQHLVFIG